MTRVPARRARRRVNSGARRPVGVLGHLDEHRAEPPAGGGQQRERHHLEGDAAARGGAGLRCRVAGGRRRLRLRQRWHDGAVRRAGSGRGPVVHPARDEHDSADGDRHAEERGCAQGGAHEKQGEDRCPQRIRAGNRRHRVHPPGAQRVVVGGEGHQPGHAGGSDDAPEGGRVDAEPVGPDAEHGERDGHRQRSVDSDDAHEEVQRDEVHVLEQTLVDHRD